MNSLYQWLVLAGVLIYIFSDTQTDVDQLDDMLEKAIYREFGTTVKAVSSQTCRQMPVARVYQIPPLPRCLPRG